MQKFLELNTQKMGTDSKSMVANGSLLKDDILKLSFRKNWSNLPFLYINPVGLCFIYDTRCYENSTDCQLWKQIITCNFLPKSFSPDTSVS